MRLTDEELESEWRNSPQLKKIAVADVKELRKGLERLHKLLVSDEGFATGWLYKQALKRKGEIK